VPQARAPNSQSSISAAEAQRALEERQRQLRAEAVRKQKEAAERRQAEFERAQREILNSMKGITGNELGLKGISTSEDFGLKGVGEMRTGDLGLKGVGETDLPRTLFEKGTRDSAPVDTRAKGPSKLDASTLSVMPPTVEPARRSTTPTTGAPRASVPEDPVKEFLFPGKPRIFPKNPDPPLLNPLIEQAKAKNLPVRGESAEVFYARFVKSDLFTKLDQADLHPWNDGPVYRRGKYPAVDKVVDETVQGTVDRETAGIKAACQRAVAAMNAEYAQMQTQGIIQAGDDLTAKEKSDAVYHNALIHVWHRVFEQFQRDVQATLLQRDTELAKLKSDIPRLQEASKPDVEKYLFPASKR
jgi:hypothetical protein